jgi:hypothetical protein
LEYDYTFIIISSVENLFINFNNIVLCQIAGSSIRNEWGVLATMSNASIGKASTCGDLVKAENGQGTSSGDCDGGLLRAMCDGIVLIDGEHNIVAQNYISKLKLGNLIGQRCFSALEGAACPCDTCPILGAMEKKKWYAVRLSPAAEGGPAFSAKNSGIDDMKEEMDCLKNAVEMFRNETSPEEIDNFYTKKDKNMIAP